jgi:hypothetical protein
MDSNQTQAVESPRDFGADRKGLARRWQTELELAEKESRTWIEKGRKIVKRYRDERDSTEDGAKRFNILWSNIQTLRPAVYSKKPKPEVSRRFKDSDPVGRVASLILERCLEYELEQYGDFDAALKNAVEDRLLPGRGVAWVRYEPHFTVTEDVRTVEYECAPVDYIFWEDFTHSPARTWEEVRWVGRRVYMTRDELNGRFGEEIGRRVPLGYKPQHLQEDKTTPENEAFKKAIVWEIWDKPGKQALWVTPGFDEVLDVRPDPLKLEQFFPCPRPLFATTTTSTLVPVPDYIEYQDQADELDALSERINLLTKALAVRGVYDSAQTALSRLLSENVENQLIPVESWAAFAEKGGLKGSVDWMPIDMIVVVLEKLYAAREAIKQSLYEITGMADIIRGASDPNETATAQQIKSQFASIRLKELQGEVARFGSDLLRLKAEVIAEHFQPETIVQMGGAEQLNQADAQLVMPALQLIKDDRVRGFRIDVESDSMVMLDESNERQARVEFLSAVGSFLKESMVAAQTMPQLGPLLGEMLMFGIRGFKVGRSIEGVFEKTMQQLQQAQGQQPGAQEAQAKQQEMQVKAQAEQGKQQIEQAKLQAEQAKLQLQAQKDGHEAQMNEGWLMLDQEKHAQGMQLEGAKLELDRDKALLDFQAGGER